MEEFGRLSGKGRIRASIEKQSGRLPKMGGINVTTGKSLNPSEYRENVESVRVSKNFPGEYRKRVECV